MVMQKLVVIVFVVLWSSVVFADIELPASKLLLPAPIVLAEQQEESKSFTEVKDPLGLGEDDLKNPWRAFGASLLLPGFGQRYVGSGLKAKIFFSAEVGLWSALLSFRHQAKWREDDYKLLAQVKAGADLTDKGDDFYDHLGFYDSRERYNKLGGIYNIDHIYYPDNSYYFWKWDSEESRLRFRDLKNDSRSFYRKANFTLGFIITNHVLSAVDAFFAAKRHNRHFDSGFGGIDFKMQDGGGFMLTVKVGI